MWFSSNSISVSFLYIHRLRFAAPLRLVCLIISIKSVFMQADSPVDRGHWFWDPVHHHVCDSTYLPIVFLVTSFCSVHFLRIAFGISFYTIRTWGTRIITLATIANVLVLQCRLIWSTIVALPAISFPDFIKLATIDLPSYGWWVDYVV